MKSEAFVDELRQALNHLLDKEFLRRSALVDLLGLESRDDPAGSLRSVLEEAIDAFRPVSDSASRPKRPRHYHVLRGRYFERLTQSAVADRLGVTTRHLRREQAAALSALAEYLNLQFDLFDESHLVESVTRRARTTSQSSVDINREMLWLADSLRDQTSEIEPVLGKALELAQVLARQRSVELCLSCASAISPAAIPPIVLKQIVLNLLTAAIHRLSPGEQVKIVARADADHVAVKITAAAGQAQPWRSGKSLGAAGDVSRRLVESFKGELTQSEIDNILVVTVRLPCTERRAIVLAIEDNLDTLRMWRRYLQRTRFSLIEETDPECALATAAKSQPELIVLDIMLTGIDGWELLGRLRHHPATAPIPIVVCTVLPQRDLALSLGASGFIQKPTTGREFRAALEEQILAARRPR